MILDLNFSQLLVLLFNAFSVGCFGALYIIYWLERQSLLLRGMLIVTTCFLATLNIMAWNWSR